MVTSLREENQGLKREIKSIEQVKSSIQQENLEASRSRENEMVMRMGQQGSMLAHYEK